MEIFNYNSVEKIIENIDSIKKATDKDGFSIIRTALDIELLNACRDSVVNEFKPELDIRTSGKYTKDMKDLQRLDVGEYPSSSRLCRYFFRFPWNDNENFSKISNNLLSIRNKLSGKKSNFGKMGEDEDPKRFAISYIIHYPTGGGFMSEHREHTLKEEGDNAYVVYTTLTMKGVDFENGGGYVVLNDQRINIDDFTKFGDIVIYRGDKFHGVESIDQHKPVNLNSVTGRLMFTTAINYFED